MGDEVVIIGAGIVGCATAYFLASAGVAVTVLDRSGIAAGASGRNNGLLEHPYDTATVGLFDETVELMRMALGDAMAPTPVGTLLLAEDEPTVHSVLDHCRHFPELSPRLLGPDEACAAEPMLAAGLWGCMLDTGYLISPVAATTAFADLARRAGAEFVSGSELPLLQYNAAGITQNGLLEGAGPAAVVVAAGAQTPEVLAGLMAPDMSASLMAPAVVTPLWGVIVAIELPDRPRHPLIEAKLAIGVGTGELDAQAPFTLLDAPSSLAVGSTLLEGAEPSGEEWAHRLLARGARFVPAIADAQVQRTLVCARPRSFDNRPILGRVPGTDRLWIASGHGGRGMSLGAASGRLMAEAILAGNDAMIPAELGARRLSG